jgi:hypothetical protein
VHVSENVRQSPRKVALQHGGERMNPTVETTPHSGILSGSSRHVITLRILRCAERVIHYSAGMKPGKP